MIFSCPAKPFPKLLEFTFQNGPGSVVHGPYFAEEGMDFRTGSYLHIMSMGLNLLIP
jgi:hypothetical protein